MCYDLRYGRWTETVGGWNGKILILPSSQNRASAFL